MKRGIGDSLILFKFLRFSYSPILRFFFMLTTDYWLPFPAYRLLPTAFRISSATSSDGIHANKNTQ